MLTAWVVEVAGLSGAGLEIAAPGVDPVGAVSDWMEFGTAIAELAVAGEEVLADLRHDPF
jgi:hypothetical protein